MIGLSTGEYVLAYEQRALRLYDRWVNGGGLEGRCFSRLVRMTRNLAKWLGEDYDTLYDHYIAEVSR